MSKTVKNSSRKVAPKAKKTTAAEAKAVVDHIVSEAVAAAELTNAQLIARREAAVPRGVASAAPIYAKYAENAELWDVDLSGVVDLWVEFGQADEKWLRKASGRAKQVVLYTYGGRSVPIWWQQNQSILSRFKNLKVVNIPEQAVEQLAGFVGRNMAVQVNINEGQVWLSNADMSVLVEPEVLQ